MKRDSHYRIARAEWEKSYLLAALERHNGHVPKAAIETGIGRTQMYRLLQRHGIIPQPVARKPEEVVA